jgi:hypothetical protein
VRIRKNLADLKRLGMLQRQCMNRRERIWTVGGEALGPSQIDIIDPRKDHQLGVAAPPFQELELATNPARFSC